MRRWKRTIGLALLAVALASLAASVPLTAAGGPGKEVTIGVRLDFTSSTHAEGTFAACCAVEDAGAASAEILSFTPKGNQARFEATNTFDGAKGSFTISLRGTTGPLDRSVHVARARWRVIDGSGAYEHVRGGGKFTATTDQDSGALTGIDRGELHGAED